MASPAFPHLVPVLPSSDIARDVAWYETHTGFTRLGGDHMYVILGRGPLVLHLQWHADTPEDPLLGGSVLRWFVEDIHPLVEEFVARGTISRSKLQENTPWGTHEFGFYDLNGNALFVVQDA
ncbi:MAG: glyoxalase/bleomycin resistance/extradiol dioxygenase family protein [Bacteroidia bacterium]|nr:glyoxalase/bleomycin resistance/extradiol dioxygenase family protein [Bacteroidia bacterium]